MKKLSQAIIGATLILDVAVVFTFGLAVISSFEDGSRLPETTFVRKASEGRVAGETISTCPSAANISISAPIAGAIITSETFRIKAATTLNVPASTLMHFAYSISVSPLYVKIPATLISVPSTTMYEWAADVNIATNQIPSGPFVFRAEGYNSMGNCIARSSDRSITINYASSNTLPASVINIISPQSGDTLAGPQATVIGEIINLPAGTQIQETRLIILNNGAAVGDPIDALVFDTTNLFKRRSIFNSTEINNGAYNLKMRTHYLDSSDTLKLIESPAISINIDNPDTTATNANTAPSNANTSTAGTNINSANTINTNTSTSASGTNTNGTALTNSNASTDTTSPPPTGTTAATMTVAMTNPTPSTIPTILRSRDNPLIAKTSTAVSGLKFIVHKSDEPVDQTMPLDAVAVSSDKINWKANMNLTVFKDGAYDITAVSGDIKSKPVNVIVQEFSFKWLTPNKGDELSKKVALKSEINGIYGIDNKTPMNGIVVEFWQFSVASSYPPKYIGKAQKKPDSHEWFYEWNTTDSPLGDCRLEVRIGDSTYSTTKGSLYKTYPLSVKVLNQISSASSGSSNSNTNQNSNTPPSVNSNTTNANKAVNSAINSSVTINQNANTAAGLNSNLNLAQDSLNINSSTDGAVLTQTDSDNDKLSDEKEAQLGTNPNSNDTDGDGLFDREEAEVHGTNPLNIDTDGDGYNDFEEIQSGHDPLTKPTDSSGEALLKARPVEEPKTAGVIAKDILAVEDVYTPIKELAKIANDGINSLTSDTVNGSEPLMQEQESKIILKGKGPANTILTLFIYSNDPIVVTVRTNENGEWIYELDKTLEDGEHEVYATITDDTGKIESKSSPMRFLVKQARAETIPERADTDIDSIPGSSSTNLYLLISGIMVFIAIVAGFIIALRRKRGDTNQIM